jgi:hypothetical protein
MKRFAFGIAILVTLFVGATGGIVLANDDNFSVSSGNQAATVKTPELNNTPRLTTQQNPQQLLKNQNLLPQPQSNYTKRHCFDRPSRVVAAPRFERTSPRVQPPGPCCLTVVEFLRSTVEHCPAELGPVRSSNANSNEFLGAP